MDSCVNPLTTFTCKVAMRQALCAGQNVYIKKDSFILEFCPRCAPDVWPRPVYAPSGYAPGYAPGQFIAAVEKSSISCIVAYIVYYRVYRVYSKLSFRIGYAPGYAPYIYMAFKTPLVPAMRRAMRHIYIWRFGVGQR